ncbi:MAG: hypothetical protein AAFQ20_12755, partial [Bacteroidota bacterium]
DDSLWRIGVLVFTIIACVGWYFRQRNILEQFITEIAIDDQFIKIKFLLRTTLKASFLNF